MAISKAFSTTTLALACLALLLSPGINQVSAARMLTSSNDNQDKTPTAEQTQMVAQAEQALGHALGCSFWDGVECAEVITLCSAACVITEGEACIECMGPSYDTCKDCF